MVCLKAPPAAHGARLSLRALRRAAGRALLGALMLLAAPGAARAADCASEAAALSRDAAELPKVELANPGDHENTCITLEVNLDFAARLAAHARACPTSPLAGEAPLWAERATRDEATFAKRRCRRSY